jgi:hypothetical protein
MRSRTKTLLGPTILLALLALAWTGAVSAEEPLARIEAAAKNLQAQVKNATMKLNHTVRTDSGDTAGLRSGSEGPQVTSPVKECCTRNLSIIQDRMQTIAIAVRELYDRHQKKDQQQAVAAVAHMAETYRLLNKSVGAFGSSNEVAFAKIHLNDVKAELSHFVNDIDKYRAAIGKPPAGTESASESVEQPDQGKSEKKKKKKSGSASGDAAGSR